MSAISLETARAAFLEALDAGEAFSATSSPRLSVQISGLLKSRDETLGTFPGISPLTRKSFHTGSLRAGELVSFRGMVQDTFDPEYFLAAFSHGKERHCAAFSEVLQVQPEGDTQLSERYPLYVVPVPGLNSWAQPEEVDPDTSEIETGKRSRDEPVGEEPSTRNPPKKLYAEVETKSSEGCSSSAMDVEGKSQSAVEVKEEKTEEKLVRLSKDLECIVKVYGTDVPRLNQACDFVGFLSEAPEEELGPSADPLHTALPGQYVDAVEERARNPPPSAVPRLHVLSWAPVESDSSPDYSSEACEEQRQRVMGRFADVLGGDVVTAEYLLCALISRVCPVQGVPHGAVGPLPLNILGDSGLAHEVSTLLRQVAKMSTCLQLSRKMLNDGALAAPVKDYAKNRLLSSKLQVPSSCVLCVDETTLDVGKLSSAGTVGLGNLKKIFQEQQMMYDFDFFQKAFPTDCVCVCVSESSSIIGDKGFLTTMRHLPEPSVSNPTRDEVSHIGDADVWKFVAKARDLYLRVGLEEDVYKLAEEEFVQRRQEASSAARASSSRRGGEKGLASSPVSAAAPLGPELTSERPKIVTQKDLERWITITKLLAASSGCETASKTHWQSMLALEDLRIARL